MLTVPLKQLLTGRKDINEDRTISHYDVNI